VDSETFCIVIFLQKALTFEHLGEHERDESRRDVLRGGAMRSEAEAHDYADQHHDLGGHQNLPSGDKQEKYAWKKNNNEIAAE
jgi:hypothetical protein